MTTIYADSPPLPPCLLVSGPTASGKSALSIHLAKVLGGEVINIDSVQVYRGADIGSAKLSPAEQEGVPHHLLDLWEVHERGDVALLRERVLSLIPEIVSRGKLPILVGSSGMYLTALLHGLADLPRGDPEIRRGLEQREERELWEELHTVDPTAAAKINPHDRLRLVRALESWKISGIPPSMHLAAQRPSPLRALGLVLLPPRAELYDRINRRSQLMVEQGLVEETRRIAERCAESPVLQALGYRQANEVLAGSLAPEELSRTVALFTRRYAKRQVTFWRNEPAKRGWRVMPEDGAPETTFEEGHQLWCLARSLDDIVHDVRNRLRLPLTTTEIWRLLPPATP